MRLLVWRPSRAISIAYWYLTRRRVRARNRLRDAIADTPFGYRLLISQYERRAALEARPVTSWLERPLLSILICQLPDGDPAWPAAVLRSALRQNHDRWELLLVGATLDINDPRVRILPSTSETSPLATAIAAARGTHVVPLAHGDILSDSALSGIVAALRAHPHARIVYGDEDQIDPRGRRHTPWFKPRWNAEMILALDFVSHACGIDTAAARDALDDPAFHADGTAYGLVLAVTRDPTASVEHISHVITHVAARLPKAGQDARVRAVAARVLGEGATAGAGPFGTVAVRWPMPDPVPAVTILIPTRDRLELVRACVDSLLKRTRYPNYMVVIVDNDSVEPATKDYFAQIACDPRVQVLPCNMPYNFSAINNAAVAQTGGDYLCFLNNDTEVIDGDWLGELMRYAVRPDVGAVGAQLLYEDRSIQHAGVVIGLGGAAGHAHRGLPEGDPGYFAQAHAAHHASAVTAACLMVAREKFLAVGGFDAEQLQIAYNDVDLCLKLNTAGWRTVYAPQAKLLHLESRSRGADLSPTHIERYRRELAVLQARWDTITVVDPLHHPLLDRRSEIYRPSL
jgi:GT2 family glycosyltransferase